MEPIRDPAMATMRWEGWTLLWKGPRPQEGEACMLRLRENTGGLAPREYIRETRGVYRVEPGVGWEDGQGRRIGFRGVIAWRPLTAQEQAWLW